VEPPSACRRIAMIWLSVNRDCFMQNLLKIQNEKILLLNPTVFRGDYLCIISAPYAVIMDHIPRILRGE